MKKLILKLKAVRAKKHFLLWAGFLLLAVILFLGAGFWGVKIVSYEKNDGISKIMKGLFVSEPEKSEIPPLDTVAYDLKLKELANNTTTSIPTVTIASNATNTNTTIPATQVVVKPELWPVKTVYPNAGAILPFSRIIAYYGNLYSTKMGVLGKYPEDEMLKKLGEEVKKWNEADPNTPVVPALHYIAVVAQGSKGEDGKYRLRMPDSEIDKVIKMAEKIPVRNASGIADAGGNAIVFLDIQVGLSNLQTEVPLLEKYLKLPQVHLGIDPEFSMKTGARPGTVIGTFDAEDINFATDYLAKIVKENNLTPKIFIVHRYTQKMITNYKNIKLLPEVQIVMNMDGWGGQAKKKNTYQQFIYKEPVQFTGFKLFYKNDVRESGTVLMTPENVLGLRPKPIYIQYQ